MAMLDSGPKLDWTRDNQMYECYRVWKKKVEFIFCSALADSTPKQLVSYLKYWMGDQGIPLIEKWESTGKLDYSNAEETPATDGGRRRILSSGYKVQTYWDLLDEEFKPKGNKLLSIIELWTRSKQRDKPLNQWLTQVYNLVNICKYPEDSTDRIIRDVLIVGCNSNHARDKIIRQGEAVNLKSSDRNSTNRRIDSFYNGNRSRAMTRSLQVPYTIRHTIVEVRNPRLLLTSRIPVLPLQVPRENAFGVVNPSADNTWKNAGHRMSFAMVVALKVISRNVARSQVTSQKIGSNRQNNQSPSTGSGKMNFASTLPQTEAEFFDEKGLLKEYNPQQQQQQQQHTGNMFILKKVQDPNNAISSFRRWWKKSSIQFQIPDPAPILSPDFPFQEFPLTEVVNQSQIDYYSISDTTDPRECSNSSRKATKSTDLPLKSGLANRSHEEMRGNQRFSRICSSYTIFERF